MSKPVRSRTPGMPALLALLALLAGPAIAQVPQYTTFSGRLVDDAGDPLVGPVNLELRVFRFPVGADRIYSEEHVGVSLDAAGGFSVQLGKGTVTSGTFDAELFGEVPRWVEVVVDGEVLTPRQVVSSVPWALVAERANEIVPDPDAPRFEDCGDGTVADHHYGLVWEKKTGTLAQNYVICATEGCPDPHDVNNLYAWSVSGTGADGNVFTDFLTRLNGEFDPDAATGCFADHCDWRLPKISELQMILTGPEAAPGQAVCLQPVCIDADFEALGGPTALANYWSSSATGSTTAWLADFEHGLVSLGVKTVAVFTRAVRTGACP